MPSPKAILKLRNDAEKIRKLIAVLRGTRGCAWDRAQTPETLAPMLIEEAYEVVEAIEGRRAGDFEEEIGDMLFLVMTLIHVAAAKGRTSYAGIVRRTAEKYIVRHPHVFKSGTDLTPDQILTRWERQKAAQTRARPFDSIPRSLPALYQAKRIYEKADRLGIAAASRRKKSAGTARSRKYIGTALLRLARAAVRQGIDPETELRREIRGLREDFKRRIRARKSR